ncbi:hypothetical protein STEG23_011197 [Scotinomys teguina]
MTKLSCFIGTGNLKVMRYPRDHTEENFQLLCSSKCCILFGMPCSINVLLTPHQGKLIFVKDGAYYRKPQLIKLQRTSGRERSAPVDTSTMQLLHPWLM